MYWSNLILLCHMTQWFHICRTNSFCNHPKRLCSLSPWGRCQRPCSLYSRGSWLQNVLHVAAASTAGHRKIIIRTCDSDVVVLAVSAFLSLEDNLDELWIAFGMQNHFRYEGHQFLAFYLFKCWYCTLYHDNATFILTYRYIPVHAIISLERSKAKALPAFHALTGCDVTSSFFGKGKKKAWSVWQSYPELTQALEILSRYDVDLQMVMLCSCMESIRTVDEARLYLFIHKGRDFENMPPSSDALHQHLLRVAYQVSIYTRVLIENCITCVIEYTIN